MSSDAFDPEPPLQPPPAEDWPARIEALLAEAETAPVSAERTAMLCRISEIYERRLGDPNGALVTLQTALAEDPASGQVIQEMERIARGHGIWGELVTVTADVASGLEDRKQAADLWVQIAFWNETGRAQLDEAGKAAETALELEPEHGGALALLENLYRRQRNWDRYVQILGRKRERPGADPGKLGDAYREVLRYEARHPGALEGLARLQEEGGAWDDAAETRRRLIAAVPEGDQRIEAQYGLAKLLKERLGDPRGAEEQLAVALTVPGGEVHVPSLLLLAALYRERKDWLKARQLLGRAAAAVSDVVTRTRILGEAADICANELDDEAQAANLYTEIVALDETRPISSKSSRRSSSGAATSPACFRWPSCWRTPPRESRRPSARAGFTGWGAHAKRRATTAGRSRPTAPPPSPRSPPRRCRRRPSPRAGIWPT